MKLFFLAGSLNQGGAEFQLLKLAQLCKRNGHDITIVALTDYDFYLDFVNQHEIPYKALKNNASKSRRVFQVVQEINAFKPEVVISYLREVSLVALIAKLLCRQRFRLIIGERTSLVIPNYDRYYFQLCRFANALTVNALSKEVYIKENFNFLEEKLFFTPNILSLEKFKWAEGHKRPKQIKRLGYIGRISKEKNLINLVKALEVVNRNYSDWSLDLFGGVRDQTYFDELFDTVKTLGLEEKVKYRGISNDITAIYKRIDALCLLSIFEGFSNVLSEGIASGLTILTSNIKENAFLVEHTKGGLLVDRYDIENISEGILNLFSMTAGEIEETAEFNRQKAFELFDENQTYQRYLDILTK